MGVERAGSARTMTDVPHEPVIVRHVDPMFDIHVLCSLHQRTRPITQIRVPSATDSIHPRMMHFMFIGDYNLVWRLNLIESIELNGSSDFGLHPEDQT